MSTATHGSGIDTTTTASTEQPVVGGAGARRAREDQLRYAAHQDQIPADPRPMLLLGAVLSPGDERLVGGVRAHTSTVPFTSAVDAPRVVGDR